MTSSENQTFLAVDQGVLSSSNQIAFSTQQAAVWPPRGKRIILSLETDWPALSLTLTATGMPQTIKHGIGTGSASARKASDGRRGFCPDTADLTRFLGGWFVIRRPGIPLQRPHPAVGWRAAVTRQRRQPPRLNTPAGMREQGWTAFLRLRLGCTNNAACRGLHHCLTDGQSWPSSAGKSSRRTLPTPRPGLNPGPGWRELKAGRVLLTASFPPPHSFAARGRQNLSLITALASFPDWF